jgi:hypothetical protein
MARERQEINRLGLTREQKLQTELVKIYPEQASEWSARIVSFLNNEGGGNWKMVDVGNGCELQYGKFIGAFRVCAMPEETRFGTMGIAVKCGRIENIILVQENSQKRSLTIIMDNDQNAKMVVRNDDDRLCVCLSRREVNGIRNHQ